MKAVIVGAALVASLPAWSRPAQATEVSFELRHTLAQTKMTADTLVAFTGTLALAVTEHVWVGAGYEIVQNHDATIWKSSNLGYKPIVLSAIRAGCWYRGGEQRHGVTYAIGPAVSYANAAISLGTSPSSWTSGLDNGTYFVDSGPDMSIGVVGTRGRIEAFLTPAWSYGRVASPAISQVERLHTFAVRFGVAFSLIFGS